MKLKQWKLGVLAMVLPQCLLLGLIIAMPVVQRGADSTAQWISNLRQLNKQHLQLIRSLDILKSHQHVIEAVDDKANTVHSMTLSLIEAIERQARAEQMELTQLTVSQAEPQQTSNNSDSVPALHALSVNFAVEMDRAMSLPLFFDAISTAADWRPSEVRGCSVVRLAELAGKSQATCSVDVYFFPAVDK